MRKNALNHCHSITITVGLDGTLADTADLRQTFDHVLAVTCVATVSAGIVPFVLQRFVSAYICYAYVPCTTVRQARMDIGTITTKIIF